jgi:transcriptional regulator of met regulon
MWKDKCCKKYVAKSTKRKRKITVKNALKLVALAKQKKRRKKTRNLKKINEKNINSNSANFI